MSDWRTWLRMYSPEATQHACKWSQCILLIWHTCVLYVHKRATSQQALRVGAILLCLLAKRCAVTPVSLYCQSRRGVCAAGVPKQSRENKRPPPTLGGQAGRGTLIFTNLSNARSRLVTIFGWSPYLSILLWCTVFDTYLHLHILQTSDMHADGYHIRLCQSGILHTCPHMHKAAGPQHACSVVAILGWIDLGWYLANLSPMHKPTTTQQAQVYWLTFTW